MYSGFSAATMDIKASRTLGLYADLQGKSDMAQVAGTSKSFASYGISEACFTGGAGGQGVCKAARNRMIAQLMTESVMLCGEHLNQIYGREAALNIATGTIATLASGIATISGEGAAKTLSALSAFANGERSLFNETIYKNILTTAVATKIRELRAEKARALLRAREKSIADYSVEEAIQDAVGFHETCSFRVGLETALAEGTQTTPDTRRERLEARATQLRIQIEAYAKANQQGGKPASYTLVEGSTEKIQDPILRSLVKQFLNVSSALETWETVQGRMP
jgi:hypothetical protein